MSADMSNLPRDICSILLRGYSKNYLSTTSGNIDFSNCWRWVVSFRPRATYSHPSTVVAVANLCSDYGRPASIFPLNTSGNNLIYKHLVQDARWDWHLPQDAWQLNANRMCRQFFGDWKREGSISNHITAYQKFVHAGTSSLHEAGRLFPSVMWSP